MELSHQQGLMEDLASPWIESWSTTFPSSGENNTELFPGEWNYFETSHPFLDLITSSSVIEPTFNCHYINENYPFDHHLMAPSYDIVTHKEERPSMEAEDGSQLIGELGNNLVEPQLVTEDIMNKSNNVEGKPSKNLMAERRRRKRLNERLFMLRSIVPKISKMDRTSILKDTIDYMKELLEKIHTLKDNNAETGQTDQTGMGGSIRKEFNTHEVQLRTLHKFDVQRQDSNTRIEIRCSSMPGILLNTVNTLEALGLDIQQCVASNFSDFSLQASCSETADHRTIISSEDLKQVLCRTAGYGGRCL